jgi:hypothetical protein
MAKASISWKDPRPFRTVKIEDAEWWYAKPKPDGEDGTGGGAGNQVKMLDDFVASTASYHVIPFGKYSSRERPSKPASIQGENPK